MESCWRSAGLSGETMALAMLVGNANQISWSIFSPANTLAALLANNFPEAGARQVSVLMFAALTLLASTLAVDDRCGVRERCSTSWRRRSSR